MELWIEGSIEQAVSAVQTGLVSAVATNPSIIAKWTQDGRTLEAVVREICEKVEVPVFVQLRGYSVDDFIFEMTSIHKISDQIQPKLIATAAGIAATKRLAEEGFKPLVTTISTVSQGFMAGVAGAAYIAPYVGRIIDAGVDPFALMENISRLYAQNNIATQIAAASIRSAEQAEKSLLAGAPIVVMQYEVFEKLFEAPLTQAWVDRFEENWQQFVFEGSAERKLEKMP